MSGERGLPALFAHREPRLLLIGQGVSQFGDGVSLVAITLLVLETAHTPTRLAWVFTARLVPMILLLLVGGVIVDRYSRRTLMLISDAVRAALTFFLALLIVTGHLVFDELLIYSALFGCFDAVFTPASSALTPEIVPDSLLGSMNSARALSSNLLQNMIGPAVGGVLAALSTTLAITVDACTFVVSALALVFMKGTPTPVVHESRTVWSDISGGLVFLRRTRWFWTTLSAVTLVNALVFTPLFVLFPFFIRHTLHLSKAWVGYGFAASGVAGVLSALVSSQLPIPRRRVRVMWMYWTVGTLAGVVFGLATNFWIAAIFPFVAGVSMVGGNVVWESMMQSEVPREMLGRASSVDWLVSLGVSPIGVIVASSVASVIGVKTYFVIASLVLSIPGLWIMVSHKINAIDEPRLAT